MNEESPSGKEVACALLILLTGAQTLIESEHLGDGQDNDRKALLRKKLFRQDYWLRPFGSISALIRGLSQRMSEFGSGGRATDDLPNDLKALCNWIHTELSMRESASLEKCAHDKTRIVDPALIECRALFEGKKSTRESLSP